MNIGHELAHAHVVATTDANDVNLVNALAKAPEPFPNYDSKIDVYMPIRGLPNFKKHIHEFIDTGRGKMYSVESTNLFCICCDDLLCYLKNGDYVPADEFFKFFDILSLEIIVILMLL